MTVKGASSPLLPSLKIQLSLFSPPPPTMLASLQTPEDSWEHEGVDGGLPEGCVDFGPFIQRGKGTYVVEMPTREP